MTPELWGLVIAGVLGTGGVGAWLTAWSTRRKTDADALGILSAVWHSEIDRLTERVELLEAELAAGRTQRRLLEALLIEHRIQLPPDLRSPDT